MVLKAIFFFILQGKFGNEGILHGIECYILSYYIILSYNGDFVVLNLKAMIFYLKRRTAW